jgi:hypothetical protein
LGLKPPAFAQDFVASPHRPVAQSVVDALYRGDALAAKKLVSDYVKAAPDATQAKKRLTGVLASVRSANPLKFGSTSNKDFAAAFWKWAASGNVSKAQLQEFRELVDNFNEAYSAAGLTGKFEPVQIPGERSVRSARRSRTLTQDLLREAIRKEQLKARLQHR